MSIRLLVCAVFVSFATAAHAAPVSFTVHGSGGTSAPVAGISPDPFLWLNGGGGIPLAYDFSALSYPGNTWGDSATGSYLVSSEFTVTDPSELRLSLLMMNREAAISSWQDSGFALLVQDDNVVAVLVNGRSNSYGYLGDSGPFPQVMLAPTSAGVTVSQTQPALGPVTVGGTDYGPGVSPIGCGSCFNHVTSTYLMGPGTYQLVIGQVNGGTGALAVTDLNVPEPATLTLLLLGGPILIARRRRAAKATRINSTVG